MTVARQNSPATSEIAGIQTHSRHLGHSSYTGRYAQRRYLLGRFSQNRSCCTSHQTCLLKGYARFSLLGKDYPALIKHEATSIVDGLLLYPQDMSQRTKLDDFEGEAYIATPVQVTVVGQGGQLVDADVYLWNGEQDAVSADYWDLNTFIQERLDDWIELFAGMELVGD